MSYHVKLEIFEGPFDLLFHLIEEAKVDIYDIPIAQITAQYIKYIEGLNKFDLEITSEFLVMASTLMEIKSKMLLPNIKEKEVEDSTEQSDPREILIEKLIEYKKFKDIATKLRERESTFNKILYKQPEDLDEYTGEIITELPDIDKTGLRDIFQRLCNEKNIKNEEPFALVHKIEQYKITVEDKIQELEEIFKFKTSIKFRQLFNPYFNIKEFIITFLAILELAKIKFLYIKQEKDFGEILIEKTIPSAEDDHEKK